MWVTSFDIHVWTKWLKVAVCDMQQWIKRFWNQTPFYSFVFLYVCIQGQKALLTIIVFDFVNILFKISIVLTFSICCESYTEIWLGIQMSIMWELMYEVLETSSSYTSNIVQTTREYTWDDNVMHKEYPYPTLFRNMTVQVTTSIK